MKGEVHAGRDVWGWCALGSGTGSPGEMGWGLRVGWGGSSVGLGSRSLPCQASSLGRMKSMHRATQRSPVGQKGEVWCFNSKLIIKTHRALGLWKIRSSKFNASWLPSSAPSNKEKNRRWVCGGSLHALRGTATFRVAARIPVSMCCSWFYWGKDPTAQLLLLPEKSVSEFCFLAKRESTGFF